MTSTYLSNGPSSVPQKVVPFAQRRIVRVRVERVDNETHEVLHRLLQRGQRPEIVGQGLLLVRTRTGVLLHAIAMERLRVVLFLVKKR